MPDTTPIVEARLPQDLERVIFEIAAYNERSGIPTLQKVARRVKVWLEPILNEMYIVRTGGGAHWGDADAMFYYNHPLQLPDLQPHHIKHLLVGFGTRPGAEYILQRCYNVQNLTVWGFGSLTLDGIVELLHSPHRTVSPPGLLRLSAAMLSLFPERKVDFNLDILQDLTHLDVLDTSFEWQEGNNYACLKNLRYLAFQMISNGISGIIQICLEECKALEVLLLYYSSWATDRRVAGQLPKVRRVVRSNGDVEEVEEDRVVIITQSDIFQGNYSWVDNWVRGATGDEDLWTRAEKTVEERRRRKKQVAL
ncbi:hypothetical protein AX16_005088 [Volvariella volvacea WC 439]|nr:hypothetical protein AX16_005088 [Volvariella volvacea WC 439]